MVIKIIELIGISEKGFEEAVARAVTRASQTIRNVTGVDVIKFSAEVEEGRVVRYKANVKVAFTVEE